MRCLSSQPFHATAAINAICRTTGAASQAMLYFLKQMHNRDRERLERGQVAFDLKAVHVIEAAIVASPQSSDSKAPQQLVDSCHKAGIPLHVIPLEAIFLPVCEPILTETSGCCPSLHHLQSDLHRLLQVSSCNPEQNHLFIAKFSKPHNSTSRPMQHSDVLASSCLRVAELLVQIVIAHTLLANKGNARDC